MTSPNPLGDSFLLDSDVAIERLRNRAWATSLLADIDRAGGIVYYSPVTSAEVYHGSRPGEDAMTAQLFGSLTRVPIDHRIGRQAGDYLRRYRPSHGLALGDAA